MVRIVRPVGPLDVYVAHEVLAHVTSGRWRADDVILDLAEVTLLDSAGVRTLVKIGRDASRRGATFRVHCPADGHLARVLALTLADTGIDIVGHLGGHRTPVLTHEIDTRDPSRQVKHHSAAVGRSGSTATQRSAAPASEYARQASPAAPRAV